MAQQNGAGAVRTLRAPKAIHDQREEVSMRVRDLLKQKETTVLSVEPDMPVASAAHRMMRHGVGGLAVVGERGGVAGFVAERDIVRAVDEHPDGVRRLAVEQIMQRPPTCTLDDPIHDVMSRMTRSRLRHLVVLDGERAVGIVSVGDLVKHRLEQLETEAGVLRDYVAAQRAIT